MYFRNGLHLRTLSPEEPPETWQPASAGSEGTGGYLKGIVGGDRLDLQSKHLNIDFLETNIDFMDGLIRPWIIAASYKGLINLMMATDASHLMPRFREEVAKLDKIRNEDFWKVFPELNELA